MTNEARGRRFTNSCSWHRVAWSSHNELTSRSLVARWWYLRSY